MNRRNIMFAMAGTLAALSTTSLTASAAMPWVYIGRRRVGLFVDHDTISPPAPFKIYRKLKLSVTGNALYMYDLKVTFHNGGVQYIPVRWHIPEGGGTRIIDLNGGDRIVKKVEFIYGKMPNGRGRTYVHLFGQI